MILQFSLEYHLSPRKHSCMHLIPLIFSLSSFLGHLRFINWCFNLDLYWDDRFVSDSIVVRLLTFNCFNKRDPLLKLSQRRLNITEKGLRRLDVLI